MKFVENMFSGIQVIGLYFATVLGLGLLMAIAAWLGYILIIAILFLSGGFEIAHA